MDHYEHVVVGAGVEGSWTALQLVRLSRGRVLLLEQFPLPHSRGSSHGQTRIIRHAYPQKFHAELMPAAYEEWFQLERETGEKLFVLMPLLYVASDDDPTQSASLDANLLSLRAVLPGQEGVKFRELGPRDLAREYHEATLTSQHRGCLDITAGLLRPDRCLAAIQRRFKQLGGEVRDGATVTSLVPGPRVTLHVTSGVNNLKVTADKVAVCAGPWTAKLIDPLLNIKLPLCPIRINVYYWKVKEGGPGGVKTTFIDLADNYNIWSFPELEYPGLIKISCQGQVTVDPDNRDGPTFDHSVISDYISKTFPGVDPSTPSLVEPCIYTMTPDHTMIIDMVPGQNNIAIACGFSGAGFKKAPVVGKMMTQLLNPPIKYDLSPFSLARFNKLSAKM